MITATVSKVPMAIMTVPTVATTKCSTGSKYLCSARSMPGKPLLIIMVPSLASASHLRLAHVLWQDRLLGGGQLHLVREPEHHAVCLEVTIVMLKLIFGKVKDLTTHLSLSTLLIPEGACLVHVPPGVGEHHVAMAQHQGEQLQQSWY